MMYDSFKPSSKIIHSCDSIHTDDKFQTLQGKGKYNTAQYMSTASNSSSYTTDNVDHVFKKQTLRHGKLMLWAKLIENGYYDNRPHITGNSKSFSGFTYISHWDNKCLTCKALAAYRATRSPFKVQLCQIVQKLKISQGLVSRLLGDGGEKD